MQYAISDRNELLLLKLGLWVGGEVESVVIGAKREKCPSPLWHGVYFSGLKPVSLGEISEF